MPEMEISFDQRERGFLSRAFYVIGIPLLVLSLQLAYGATRRETPLEILIFGSLTHSERIIIGIPLLFVGHSAISAIAWMLLLTKGGEPFPYPELLVKGLVRNLFRKVVVFFVFWSLLLLPVMSMGYQLYKLHSRIIFVERGSGHELKGSSLYQWPQGRWRAKTQDATRNLSLSVLPFWTPIAYDAFTFVPLCSLTCFAFVARRRGVMGGKTPAARGGRLSDPA